MRRIWLLIMCMFLIGMIGCSKDEPENPTSASFSDQIIGYSQGEIHRVHGEPSGTLSGFTGDIYYLDNGTQVILYYDSELKVEQVKIIAKDGKDKFNLEYYGN